MLGVKVEKGEYHSTKEGRKIPKELFTEHPDVV